MKQANNLWGGRFTGAADEKFVEFNRSFGFDYKLFAADIRGCRAHCEGLRRARVLTAEEADEIRNGLQMILDKSLIEVDFFDDPNAEDVHSFIESRLIEIIGDTGRKLHTGRSRNDQVATALRIWLREKIDELIVATRDAQQSLIKLAEKHRTAVLPGYTHLQRAQPVLFAHWCLAYFEMLKRDAARLSEIRCRVNVLPLGAAALAGTAYPIDREMVARDLGFDAIAENSLDAVSDRDFAIEFAGACSMLMMHLSRLSEDLIVYATSEFGFIELGDAISTGSSLMPQKKNPDALELIRGKAARVFGHHAALLTMMKGLPLAYNKDMQEDKEAVFDCVDTVSLTLRVTEIVLRNIGLNAEKSRRAAVKGYLNATELADYLVQKDVPFRIAHDTVGKIVLFAITKGRELDELSLEEMREFSERIEKDVFEALSLEKTLASKNQIGGTSPERVFEALDAAKRDLEIETN